MIARFSLGTLTQVNDNNCRRNSTIQRSFVWSAWKQKFSIRAKVL